MDTFSPDLNKDRKIPLYQQLYSYILDQLKNGTIKSGERLPSKRHLAEDLGVSRNTVDTAYQMLVSEGFLYTKERSGYFVSDIELLGLSDLKPIETKEQKEVPKEWKFDLGTAVIETDSFPVKNWNRLYRSTLSEAGDLLNLGRRQGEEALCEEIASYLYAYRGVNCRPEQIIVGAGIEYLLTLLTAIFRDKVFALEDPGYHKTQDVLNNQGIAYETIPVDEKGLSVKALRGSSAQVAYVTPSHQFPTGVMMPASRRLQLLRWASEDEGRYIIEDDYDSEFRFDRLPVPSLQGLDTNDKVIYMSTFSRSLAPSIRIAYMVLPEEFLERFNRDFQFYSSTVSRFEQITLYHFIKDGHYARHLNRIKKMYKQRRDRLVEALKKAFGEKIVISGDHTGLHLLATFSIGLSEEEMIRRAKKAGINIRGASEFFSEQVKERLSLRPSIIFGYGKVKEEEIETVVRQLREVWSN